MGVQIQIKDGILNLAQLQEKLDEVVFDHIDTSSNWKTAYTEIGNLLNQSISFFNSYVQKNDLPKSNVYWVLFMDIASRAIYFRTIAKKHLIDISNPKEKEQILQLLKKAANCLPNVQKSNNEFLKEICDSYEELELLDGKKGAVEQYYYSKNNPIEECLKEFYELALQEKAVS